MGYIKFVGFWFLYGGSLFFASEQVRLGAQRMALKSSVPAEFHKQIDQLQEHHLKNLSRLDDVGQKAYLHLPPEYSQYITMGEHPEESVPGFATDAAYQAHRDAYKLYREQKNQNMRQGGFGGSLRSGLSVEHASKDEGVKPLRGDKTVSLAENPTQGNEQLSVERKSLSLWQKIKNKLFDWLQKTHHILQAQEQLHLLEDQLKKYQNVNSNIAIQLHDLSGFIKNMQKDLTVLDQANQQEWQGFDRQNRRKKELLNKIAKEFAQAREYIQLKLDPVAGESAVSQKMVQNLDDSFKRVFPTFKEEQAALKQAVTLDSDNQDLNSQMIEDKQEQEGSTHFVPVKQNLPAVVEEASVLRSTQDVLTDFAMVFKTPDLTKEALREAYVKASTEIKSIPGDFQAALQDLTLSYQKKLQELINQTPGKLQRQVSQRVQRRVVAMHPDL